MHEFEIASLMGDSVPPGSVLVSALVDDDAPADLTEVRDERCVYWIGDADSVVLEAPRICLGLPAVVGDRAEMAESVRLLRRLHELADSGVIADQPVLACADHELSLWLYAEPALRGRVVARVLADLEAESPYRRRTLAVTLLAWLEGKRSANAVARELEIHPQTARYRLRQLRSILGDALDDRDRCFELQLALRIQLPRWLA